MITAIRADSLSRLPDTRMRAFSAPVQQGPLARVDEAQFPHVSTVCADKQSERLHRT